MQKSLKKFIPRKRWYKVEAYGSPVFVRAISAYYAKLKSEYDFTFVPDKDITVTELSDKQYMLEVLKGNV